MNIRNNIKNIIERYLLGESCSKIAKRYNCTAEGILYQLEKAKIPRRNNSQAARKYTVNENYFDNINTEDKAYFLGLMYADGYNNEKDKRINLSLQELDKHILEEFAVKLESNRPLQLVVKNKKRYYRLAINSEHLSNKLTYNGCSQRKTFDIKFPEFLSKNLLKDFIRGYFDGDGNIYIDKKGQPEFSVTGNKEFIEKLQLKLNESLALKPVKIKQKSNSYTVRYRGKKIISKLRKYLYENSNIFFNRKYEKFELIK